MIKQFNIKVLSRFMSERELMELENKYNENKNGLSGVRDIFTDQDWRMFDNPDTTIEDWKKHWKTNHKSSTTIVYNRLGRMSVLKKQGK